MSDLISRSDVNDVIDEFEVYTCGRPNTMKVEISVLQLQRFINKLKNIPTAYDIDKVIRQLNLESVGSSIQMSLGLLKAIKIVKQGCISDDVCEYKIKDEVIYTSCNNKSIASAFCWFNECGDYKYCPYCGKKIKVVE